MESHWYCADEGSAEFDEGDLCNKHDSSGIRYSYAMPPSPERRAEGNDVSETECVVE